MLRPTGPPPTIRTGTSTTSCDSLTVDSPSSSLRSDELLVLALCCDALLARAVTNALGAPVHQDQNGLVVSHARCANSLGGIVRSALERISTLTSPAYPRP